jgi:hypothetical protein
MKIQTLADADAVAKDQEYALVLADCAAAATV